MGLSDPLNYKLNWCRPPKESAKLPCVLKTCSRANLPFMLTCLRANVPSVLTCQRAMCANVPSVLRYQRAMRAYVPTCPACQHALSAYVCHVSAYLACSCTHMSTWLKSIASHGLCDHVITCQHALPPQ